MTKKAPNLKINTRLLQNNVNYILDHSDNNQRKEEFENLVQQLKNIIKSGIYNSIQTMKILKKINDNKLYVEGNFNSFRDFLSKFKLAKTQAYQYIELATAMELGHIEEEFIASNGISASIRYVRIQDNSTKKPSKQNPIKPLRFQLKSPDTYAYYKEHIKLASFLLEELYFSKREWLEEIAKKFEEFRQK
ncbi:chromosome replication/partitioning protein [Candidatus Borreliella tachyglossi]|uniref:chromosome replication/partitioning protein n=1 Tax=Candidatus Borreliella tachyglossi TaxID=1964448 RepID=UPI004041E7A2